MCKIISINLEVISFSKMFAYCMIVLQMLL